MSSSWLGEAEDLKQEQEYVNGETLCWIDPMMGERYTVTYDRWLPKIGCHLVWHNGRTWNAEPQELGRRQ